jgi:hypothetical protein
MAMKLGTATCTSAVANDDRVEAPPPPYVPPPEVTPPVRYSKCSSLYLGPFGVSDLTIFFGGGGGGGGGGTITSWITAASSGFLIIFSALYAVPVERLRGRHPGLGKEGLQSFRDRAGN